jgi:endonuclease/exonuclease/phosphatase family metal-dependent hydrolase
VETRNLYLGVDIRRAAGPTNRPDFETTARQLFSEVQATDPAGRMQLVAAELAKVKPNLVGLQEVTLWQVGSTKIDYLQLLRKDLAARHLSYRVVGTASEADIRFTFSNGDPGRFRIGNAILVKAGVKTSHVHTGVYKSQITFPTAIGNFPVRRNWGELDADVGGARFHFINTHLEAFNFTVRTQQAKQFVAGPLRHRGPDILAGDLNSSPIEKLLADRAAYFVVRGAGYVVRQSLRNTCCYKDDLKSGSLTHRIDFVMTKPGLRLLASGVVGAREVTKVGTHAADHAGAWSRLLVPA